MNIEPWMIGTAIAVLVLLWALFTYNRFISLKNSIEESFKHIDITLAQRFDSLTRIAETIAAYTKHEKEVHTEVTKLRSQFDNQNENEKVKTSNELSRLVSGLQVQVENYPELKANENYLHLQKSINELEERLAASRRTFNARVAKFNTMLQQFPTNLFKFFMKLEKRELLHIDNSKKQDVDIARILRG